MLTIGLLGGMSWESTAVYYRLINELVSQRQGGLSSAKIVMMSVNLAELKPLQHAGDWDGAAQFLVEPALKVQDAGADLLLICTNTMHKVADQVAAAVDIPLVHIADATASRLLADGVETVGLLGTRFTMEQAFYKNRLKDSGLKVVVPPSTDWDFIHQVIFEELCLGTIRDESRQRYLEVIDGLVAAGAGGVILGCTEIGLLVKPEHTDVALYDTAAIHAQAAVDLALKVCMNLDGFGIALYDRWALRGLGGGGQTLGLMNSSATCDQQPPGGHPHE